MKRSNWRLVFASVAALTLLVLILRAPNAPGPGATPKVERWGAQWLGTILRDCRCARRD